MNYQQIQMSFLGAVFVMKMLVYVVMGVMMICTVKDASGVI